MPSLGRPSRLRRAAFRSLGVPGLLVLLSGPAPPALAKATGLDRGLPPNLAPSGPGPGVLPPGPAATGHPGPHGRRERVELLTPDLRAEPAPGPGDPAPLPDGPPSRLAHVPRIPRPGRDDLLDQWLVAAGDRVLRLTPAGPVATFARAGAVPAPQFALLAAKPWAGAGDGDWVVVLWDQAGGGFWRLDAAGRLRRWTQAPSERSGWGRPWDGAYRTRVAALAMDRQGRVYASVRRIPVRGPAPELRQVVRIGPDGTAATLVGAAPGPDPGPALARPLGLVLDPDGRALHCLDLAPGNPRLVRIALPGGTVTSRRLDLPPYRGSLTGLDACQDRLVVGGAQPAAFFQVDPDTGRAWRIYRDALRSRDRRDLLLPPQPGPCFHSGRVRERCGSLGSQYRGAFAADDQGRIAFITGDRVGLVLLDWARPAPAWAGANRTRPGATSGARPEAQARR